MAEYVFEPLQTNVGQPVRLTWRSKTKAKMPSDKLSWGSYRAVEDDVRTVVIEAEQWSALRAYMEKVLNSAPKTELVKWHKAKGRILAENGQEIGSAVFSASDTRPYVTVRGRIHHTDNNHEVRVLIVPKPQEEEED
jgi:hypothetical protein